MPSLIKFFEEDHRYVIDGEEVPSVSEITRFISNEVYRDVMEAAKDNAAERGTKIHKATEALDKFGKVEIDDELTPYLKAYLAFLKAASPEWEKIEWPVHNGLLYAGTLDRYGTIEGRRAIVDIKSTASISRQHKVLYTAAQNLYRMAIEDEHPVEALYILQLKKDGNYKLIELPIEDALANACITLSTALAKKKRKKEKEND